MKFRINKYVRNFMISLLVVSVVLILYSGLTKINYVYIFKANVVYLATSFILILMSIVISAFRLKVLSNNLSLSECINLWFASQAASNITPTHSGGEIVRFAYLYFKRKDLENPLGIVLIEIIMDVYVPNIFAVILALSRLMRSNEVIYALPILFSTYNIGFWSLVLFKKRFFIKLVSKFINKVLRIEWLVEDVKVIDNPKKISLSVILSLFKVLFLGFSITLAFMSIRENISFYEGIAAYVFAMSLSIIPLPAGSIGVEAGISLIRVGIGVVLWRLLSYYLITALSFPSLLRMLHKKWEFSHNS